MNEASNTIQLCDYKKTEQLDHKTLFEVEEKVGMQIYQLKHLTKMLISVSEDMDQRDILIDIIDRESDSLHESYLSLFAEKAN